MGLAGVRRLGMFGVGGPLKNKLSQLLFMYRFTVQGGFGWVGHSESEHFQLLFMYYFTVQGGFGWVAHSENEIGLFGVGVHCFG